MVRPLSKELQKIAIEELNEDPARVEEDIKHIQEWIQQQPHLNAPTDKQWILGFLRGCKFSLQRTKEKLDMYYTLKTLIPEMMEARDTNSMEMQALLKAGIILPLPYSVNHKGPRIILMRYNNLDMSIMNPENLTAVLFMMMNILMKEDDNAIISGLILWFDLSLLPLSFVFQLSPTNLKNFFQCLRKAFPFRIKGIHGSGSFAMAQKVFMIVKGYFGSKLKSRVFIHSEDKFEDIFKAIPKKYMPTEYGGENDSVEKIKDYWKNKIESYSTWFIENNQYGTIEAMRSGNPVSLNNLGIDGSFRKLNID